jgi:hypothetical protein
METTKLAINRYRLLLFCPLISKPIMMSIRYQFPFEARIPRSVGGG